MNKEKLFAILGIGLMAIGGIMLILVYCDVVTFPFAGWVSCILIGIGSFFGGMYNSIENKKTSLFKLLVCMAAADGKITPEELMIIGEYAKQFDVNEKRFNAIVEEVEKGFDIVIPEDTSEKEKNIKALVRMANADGNIDDKELALIKEVAKKYGLSESFVDKLVNI
jgi:uncharacterized membrane protein YebE (DUF533 family)